MNLPSPKYSGAQRSIHINEAFYRISSYSHDDNDFFFHLLQTPPDKIYELIPGRTQDSEQNSPLLLLKKWQL